MTGWTAVIPTKPWELSKTRLTRDATWRAELARAFALDVVRAVRASARVSTLVLVSAEPELREIATKSDAVLLVDNPLPAVDALNDAVDRAVRWAHLHRPRAGMVVIPADLPSLSPDALDEALDLMDQHSVAFVPDLSGEGTTLLSSRDPKAMQPVYGRLSASAHSATGARSVDGVDIRVRQDVDTASDLAAAHRLGMGVHSANAYQALRWASGPPPQKATRAHLADK